MWSVKISFRFSEEFSDIKKGVRYVKKQRYGQDRNSKCNLSNSDNYKFMD